MDNRYTRVPPDRLVGLCRVAQEIGSSPVSAGVSDRLLQLVAELFNATYCAIQVTGPSDTSPLTIRRRGRDLDNDDARKIDHVLVGAVLLDQRAYRVDDLSADPRFSYFTESRSARFSAIAAPISYGEEIIGVLIAARPVSDKMTEIDLLVSGIACEMLSASIARAREVKILSTENDRLRSELAHRRGLRGLVGSSAAWDQVCEQIRTVSPSDVRVLLLGESGVGKELCARSIHELSPRQGGPFVAVNCGALTETLAESELFGHVRGAFTGAMRDSRGLFVEAEGGTLLLDEIGAAPATVQSALLRAIQEGEVRPVGATATRTVNVRVICATSANLESLTQTGEFRKDLFYRINAVAIRIPPLRHRREDIPVLAHEFLRGEAARYHRTIAGFSPEALALMTMHPWPGNARELQNAIQHAVLFTPVSENTIHIAALPAHIKTSAAINAGSPDGAAVSGLDKILEYHESELIRATLAQCDGNRSKAARLLAVPEKRIRDRMKKYRIQSP